MKKFFRSIMAALALCTAVSAVNAAVIVLDTFTQTQTQTASNATPVVADTLLGPVGGVTPLFGDRELSVSLVGGTGTVTGSISGGVSECSRTFSAAGLCQTTYTVNQAVTFDSLQFTASSDGANGEQALFTFLHNGAPIGSAVINLGTQAYLVNLVDSSFAAGDLFSVLQNTMNVNALALDQALQFFTANTPEERVPAPATAALLGLGLIGLVMSARRKSCAANDSSFRQAA